MKVINNAKSQQSTTVNKNGAQPRIFNPKKHRKETNAQALKKHFTVKNIALGALLLFGGVFSYREFYKPNDPIQKASFNGFNKKIEILRNSILLAQKHAGNENNHELFKEANACLDTTIQADECPGKILIKTKTLHARIAKDCVGPQIKECQENIEPEFTKLSNLRNECISKWTEAEKCTDKILDVLDLLKNIPLESYDISINTAFKKEDLVRTSTHLHDKPLVTDSDLIKHSHHKVEENTIVIKNAIKKITTEDDDYNEELNENDIEIEELNPDEIL